MAPRPAATAIGGRKSRREAHATWRAGTARNRRAPPLPAKHPSDWRGRNRARVTAAQRAQADDRQPTPALREAARVRQTTAQSGSLLAPSWALLASPVRA